jgi:hypothetical protein
MVLYRLITDKKVLVRAFQVGFGSQIIDLDGNVVASEYQWAIYDLYGNHLKTLNDDEFMMTYEKAL